MQSTPRATPHLHTPLNKGPMAWFLPRQPLTEALIPSFTVRKALLYAASLRLPHPPLGRLNALTRDKVLDTKNVKHFLLDECNKCLNSSVSHTPFDHLHPSFSSLRYWHCDSLVRLCMLPACNMELQGLANCQLDWVEWTRRDAIAAMSGDFLLPRFFSRQFRVPVLPLSRPV